MQLGGDKRVFMYTYFDMKLFATRESLKNGGRLKLTGRITTHPCPGKCGKAVSNNKAYCLECYQRVLATEAQKQEAVSA